MSDQSQQIRELQEKLQRLLKKQVDFQQEIEGLRLDIEQLQEKPTPTVKTQTPQSENPQQHNPPKEPVKIPSFTKGTNANIPLEETNTKKTVSSELLLEKFIGENLMNKVGILITVIGIAIGLKYAIDHQWISALARIILGYLAGLALLGTAFRLKKDYHNFSAVLFSGAMATCYFTSYAAYAFYQLFPFILVFVIMVLITLLTVYAALHYQKQIIAMIGLVGAYGIPYLLGESSSPVGFFFAYIALINGGVLLVAIKKYWKPLQQMAFGLTWLIFLSWYWLEYKSSIHLTPALFYATLYFGLFYAAFLVNKIQRAKAFKIGDIILLSANVFIYYGLGYALLTDVTDGTKLLGVFTLAMAGVHFLVSRLVHRFPEADRKIYLFILGLALVFLTITVPVQLDGSWVTLLWTFGAVLLALIGNYTGTGMYKKLSLPLMGLAFLSLGMDWLIYYDGGFGGLKKPHTPILNICFITGILFAAAMGLITLVNHKVGDKDQVSSPIYKILPPILLLLGAYFAPYLEIAAYWKQLVETPGATSRETLLALQHIWLLNYSLLFLIILGWINLRSIKKQMLSMTFLLLSALFIGALLVFSLIDFNLLQQQYLATISGTGIGSVLIRYFTYLLTGILMWTIHQYTRQAYPGPRLLPIVELTGFFILLCFSSFEWIMWTDADLAFQSPRLGLSIIWGIFATIMIAIGIGQRKSYLRIGAISLFALTLIKLFFYDLTHLEPIAKTIVLIALGVLLLGASFLYNKYRKVLFEEEEQV